MRKRAIVGISAAALLVVAAAGIALTGPGKLLKIAENAWLTVTGRLVDSGGYRLRIDCSGSGSPTVILEAGLGFSGRTWRLVQPEIAKVTRVCSYDRAGLGNSDHRPGNRDGTQVVEELRALLKAKGIAGPYLLVGHSFGGATVQIHAARYPSEVAGLVLLDPVTEQQFSHFAAQMPESEREAYLRREKGGNEERMDVAGSAALAAGLEVPANIAVILLTAQAAESSEAARKTNAEWLQLQKSLGERLKVQQHRIVENSGHFIQTDQPQIVVQIIAELTSDYRSNKAKP